MVHSANAECRLRILATSDVHMNLTGWDARSDESNAQLGMDRLATSIAEARASAPGLTILLDNGDSLQGTPVAGHCTRLESPVGHPWAAIVNALDYDAVGLGNHDFDYGLAFLEDVVDQIEPPTLCASISQGRISGVLPSVVLQRSVICSDGVNRTLSIGVTSVLPPQTVIWNNHTLAGRIALENGVESGRKAVTALKRNGADLVVVLCHSGLSRSNNPDAENFAAALAQEVPEIEALVLGHSHRVFPSVTDQSFDGVVTESGTVHGVPAVMPGYGARFLGLIDLQLTRMEGSWIVTDHAVTLLPSHGNIPDPVVSTFAAPFLSATSNEMEKELTTTGHGFQSYFEMLQTGTAGALLAECMKNIVSEHVARTALADLPLLASVAPFAVGGTGGVGNYLNIPKGKVRARHIAMVCPYSNWIWAAVLNGADLWAWAERAASYFAPERGKLSSLVNQSAPSYLFDSLFGLETTIDPFLPMRFEDEGLGAKPSRRVKALTWNGETVQPEARFLVAMTSYRGAGGGAFPGLKNCETLIRTDEKVYDSLAAHISRTPIGPVPAQSAWNFAKDLGEDVIIETAPAALGHLDDIARFDPRPEWLGDDGFMRVRVKI